MTLNFSATRPLRVIMTSWYLQHYSMLFLWKILRFQVPPFLTKKQLKKPIVAVKGGELSWQQPFAAIGILGSIIAIVIWKLKPPADPPITYIITIV
jgi:hypothetical protein